jgi:hypothetical protein
MNNLSYSSTPAFLNHTMAIAKCSKTIKLNALRDAIAKMDGFNSVKSYRLALDKQENVIYQLSEQPIFLTNGILENCGHIDKSHFIDNSIPYGEFDGEFYPLTDHEVSYLSDDAMPDLLFQLSCGYSALLNNEKFIVIAFEVEFDVDGDNWFNHDKPKARAYVEKLTAALLNVAKDVDGARVYSDSEISFEDDSGYGFCEVNLYVPFETAFFKAGSHDEWVSYIQPILKVATDSFRPRD